MMKRVSVWLTINRVNVIRLFQVIEVGLGLVFAFLFWLSFSTYSDLTGQSSYAYNSMLFAAQAGQMAVRLYAVTLWASILQRFGWLPDISRVLVLFRRHLGILMMVCVLGHYLLLQILPLVTVYADDYTKMPMPAFRFAGFFALVLLLPMFVTSNDFSIRLLTNKNWKRVQRLTYFVMFLIFSHVFLIDYSNERVSSSSVILGVTILFWIASWFAVLKKTEVLAQST